MYGKKPRRIFAFGIALSVFLVYLSYHIANERIFGAGRAQTSTSGRIFSPMNSYVFASPIKTYADGESIVRVTCVVLDYQGRGVSEVEVVLKPDKDSLFIKNIRSITDDLGRATFDLTSKSASSYSLSVQVQGAVLPYGVSVSFE